MTRLEKALELHPDLSKEEIINYYCPEELIKYIITSCPITNTNTKESRCNACWNMEYKGVKHVAKVILELEMPESCKKCPIKIKRYLHYGWVENICGIISEEIANKGRRSDCPLKPVESEVEEDG